MGNPPGPVIVPPAGKPRMAPPSVAIGRPALQLISERRARLARPVGKEIGRGPRSVSSDFRGRRTPCIVENDPTRRTPMDVRAAVAVAAGKPLEVTTVQLAGPSAGEVMVEIKATGI